MAGPRIDQNSLDEAFGQWTVTDDDALLDVVSSRVPRPVRPAPPALPRRTRRPLWPSGLVLNAIVLWNTRYMTPPRTSCAAAAG